MKMLTRCGVSAEKLKNGWCFECGGNTSCEVREQDWVSEQTYNFCKSHGCVNLFGSNLYMYDEVMFLRYLFEHPAEVRKRKWLQQIADAHNISYN